MMFIYNYSVRFLVNNRETWADGVLERVSMIESIPERQAARREIIALIDSECPGAGKDDNVSVISLSLLNPPAQIVARPMSHGVLRSGPFKEKTNDPSTED
jgi:hypothetical protein